MSQDIITMTLQQGSSLKPSIPANQATSHCRKPLPSDLINGVLPLIAVSGQEMGDGIEEKRGIKSNFEENGVEILDGKTLWTLSCHCVVSPRGLFPKTLLHRAAVKKCPKVPLKVQSMAFIKITFHVNR